MSFYQYFTFKSSGNALTSVDDFAQSSTGTQFTKNTGENYAKTASGIYDKLSRSILSQTEMDNRYPRLATSNIMQGHITPSADNTYNVGSSSKRWKQGHFITMYGKSTSANYADLAEKYQSDVTYEVGTVCEIGGEFEITEYNGGPLAGAISENPGFMLNSEAGEDYQYIALKGKIPVKCSSAVTKGQYCIAGLGGKVQGVNKENVTDADHLNIVGVALEDSKDGMVQVKV